MMVLPSLRPDPLLAAASARVRPLPAARVSAASNSGAPPSSMDEDNHHGTHMVELAVVCSGAVLEQGPPPQQIPAWINLFGCRCTRCRCTLARASLSSVAAPPIGCRPEWEVRSFAAQNPTNRRRNAQEASLIINGKLRPFFELYASLGWHCLVCHPDLVSL